MHIAPGLRAGGLRARQASAWPVIDPIDEFGVFRDGFGWQTGRYAGDGRSRRRDIARDVADDLEREGPAGRAASSTRHSLPGLLALRHRSWSSGWSTSGSSPWTRCALSRSGPRRGGTMAPAGHRPEERELDWLRNMGDWMISKKRYYGLALPIWDCADCDALGGHRLARRAAERAVAGWDEFEGHSPHRPWIDAVEIACASCGGTSRRILDVGNPWLDAGIVGLSTLELATGPRLLGEVVPGRLGHGVASPASSATGSTRCSTESHRDDRPGAPIQDALRLRAAARRARRGDAQEQGQRDLVRRRGRADRRRRHALDVLGRQPLHQYELRLPTSAHEVRAPLLPAALEHVRLLRHLRHGWTAGRRSAADEAARVGAHPPRPMDPLAASMRRSAMFAGPWMNMTRCAPRGRSRASSTTSRTGTCAATGGASGRASSTPTRRAAYATLHEVLTTLMRLMAPMTPHLTDAIWENLVASVDPAAPDSVHLTDCPQRVAGRSRPGARSRASTWRAGPWRSVGRRPRRLRSPHATAAGEAGSSCRHGARGWARRSEHRRGADRRRSSTSSTPGA